MQFFSRCVYETNAERKSVLIHMRLRPLRTCSSHPCTHVYSTFAHMLLIPLRTCVAKSAADCTETLLALCQTLCRSVIFLFAVLYSFYLAYCIYFDWRTVFVLIAARKKILQGAKCNFCSCKKDIYVLY